MSDRGSESINVICCSVCRQECMMVDVMDNVFLWDSAETPSSTNERTAQRSSASPLRPAFCDIHKQEPLKLFCLTCDLLTCRDCQLIKHKDHERLLFEENCTSVHNEIKKSICSLILEINKKGNMLVDQLEAVIKDLERMLQKQQEDTDFLSRHLDHVISFTKWATARNKETALLCWKRSILIHIENLLQAKCSSISIQPSVVHFQCLASHWASNVDLGSLVVERVPDHQLGFSVDFPPQHTPSEHNPSGSDHSFALGGARSSLAQLQMQVDKLNPLAQCQPQPASTQTNRPTAPYGPRTPAESFLCSKECLCNQTSGSYWIHPDM